MTHATRDILTSLLRALDAQSLALLASLSVALDGLEDSQTRVTEAQSKLDSLAQHDTDVTAIVSARSLRLARARAQSAREKLDGYRLDLARALMALSEAQRTVDLARSRASEALVRRKIVAGRLDSLARAAKRLAETRDEDRD